MNNSFESNYIYLEQFLANSFEYIKLTSIFLTENEELYSFAKDLIDLYKEDKDDMDDLMKSILNSEAKIVYHMEEKKKFYTKPTFAIKVEKIRDFFA